MAIGGPIQQWRQAGDTWQWRFAREGGLAWVAGFGQNKWRLDQEQFVGRGRGVAFSRAFIGLPAGAPHLIQ